MQKRIMSAFLAFVLLVSSSDVNALAMQLDLETEDNTEVYVEDNIENDEDNDTEVYVEGYIDNDAEADVENNENDTEANVEDETKSDTEDDIIDDTFQSYPEIPEASQPSDSMTQSFLVDLESPYDGDYILAANVSTNATGAAEPVGELPSSDKASYNMWNSIGYAYLEDNPDVYDFDENGRGIIDPASFLPELVLDESGIEFQADQETETVSYYIGYERDFYLNTTADSQYNSVACVCVAISEYATVWVPVEDPIYVADADLMKSYMNELAVEFDAQFPKMTEMFGSKETVDKLYGDNDGKTALLCYDINGNGMSGSSYTAGYFFAADLNINYSNRTHNNVDCLHIDSWQGMSRNTSNNTLDSVYGKRTMVHEFQHMINYSICRDNEASFVKLSIPTYLNEAYSEAAAHLCYGAATSRISNYNSNSYISGGKVSLLNWGGGDSTKLSNYSLSYLFGQYIRTQYENDDTIYKDTMNVLNESTDLFSVIADKLGVSGEELLFNFRAALFLKNAQGPYGFGGEKWAESIRSNSTQPASDLSLAPGAAVVIPAGESFEPSGAGSNIRFAGMYAELTKDDIKVQISGGDSITEDAGRLKLSASVYPKGISQSVIFSLPYPEDGAYAQVTESGLVTALSDGTITVRASSVFDPSKYADITITISGQQGMVMFEKTETLIYGGIRIAYSIIRPLGAVLYYTIDDEEPTYESGIMPDEGILIDTAGTHILKLLAHDADGVFEDNYVEEEITVEQLKEPVISTETIEIDDIYAQRVTIEVEDGTEVYYTADGSEPDMESGMLYEEPFTIDTLGTTVIKAVAVKEGAACSNAAAFEVHVYSSIVMEQIRTPVPGGIRVNYSINDSNNISEGISLYFTTNGDTPTTESDMLPEDGVVFDTAGTHILKVLAHDVNGIYKDTYAEDEIIVEKLTEPVIIAETESVSFGTKRVMIQAQDGAVIYYTIDDSEPIIPGGLSAESGNGEEYKGAFTIDTLGTTTIKAIAVKVGMAVSDVALKEVIVEYDYDSLPESERSPYLTQVSFSLNKQAVDATVFSILPIMENEIIDAMIVDNSGDFILERIEKDSNDWRLGLSSRGKVLENKTYKTQVKVISRSPDNRVYTDVIDITVKVTDIKPQVSIKAITINTVYPFAGYPINATSKSGRVEILGKAAGNNAFSQIFKIVDGVLYIEKDYIETLKPMKNKVILSGKIQLQVQVEGYEPQEIALSVKTVNKAPTLVPSTSTLRLNYNKLSGDKSFTFTLNRKVSSKEKLSLENITSVILDEEGGTKYKKAAALIQDITCSDGQNITVRFKDVKSGTYTLPLLVSTGESEDSFSNVSCKVKIVIEKKDVAPKLRLSTTKVRLNRQIGGEKAYIAVDSVSQENMELTDIQCIPTLMTESIDVNGNIDSVEFSYNKETCMIEIKALGAPAAGLYKFMCIPAYNGIPSQDKAATVTVTVIDKEPTVSLKAKGSIDVLNRETSAVTYTIKKANFSDEIIAVEFDKASKLTQTILDAGNFFNEPILNDDSTITISAKDDAVFTKGIKYAFRLKFTLEGDNRNGDGENNDSINGNSKETVVTKDIAIRPKQSKVKLTTSTKPVFYTYVNTGNNTQTVTFTNNNGTIEKVEWNTDANKKIPAGITPVIEDGQLKGVTFDGNASIKKGTYKLTFNVYYKGQLWEKPTNRKASYAKPATFKLTVSVK